ncbi:ABC transporter ATP-binding protein [Candidatus Bathyarchaeota archaeon]|nr:ABC transporter ATP-binding protein [Candidatus Bathyarchaeota archaeon]
MKAYFAAVIDRSVSPENSKLSKKLQRDLKKTLKIPNSNVNCKIHNAFIFLSAEKTNKKPLDPKTVENIETVLSKHLNEYYSNNMSKLQKYLKTKQELKETAQIVKDFLEEIDPKLPKVFGFRLRKVTSDLPTEYYELLTKSMIALWHIEEENKAQFRLSGFEPQIFPISTIQADVNLEEMVDKLALLNFFWIFLNPTMRRLQEMTNVLERLDLGLQGTHYKSNNPKMQAKLEMFLRILLAKLSALQSMERTIASILKLFLEPKAFCSEQNFKDTCKNLKTALKQMSWKNNQAKRLLSEVQEKLEKCQTQLKEYLGAIKNDEKTTQSNEDFKLALLNIAKLSSDLFVETELLKMWLDFFGSDLPYFTYQKNLFTPQIFQNTQISTEDIISVRGLIKNYSLGRTTVYALRGVDLDVKTGEFLAIVGNSGAGKTTLLNCMAGIDEPDYGLVLFKGRNLREMNDVEKSKARLLDMGFIFQSYALLPHFNIRENVTLPADLAGLSKNLKNRIEDLLKGVGIDKQAKQYPAQLSGGQMQRVAIARALTNRPKVLFADEPTGDLDSETGKQVMELIKKFHEETETTIIVITHDQEVANYAERQIILEDGVVANTTGLIEDEIPREISGLP